MSSPVIMLVRPPIPVFSGDAPIEMRIGAHIEIHDGMIFNERLIRGYCATQSRVTFTIEVECPVTEQQDAFDRVYRIISDQLIIETQRQVKIHLKASDGGPKIITDNNHSETD